LISGIWVDRQCSEHRDGTAIEILRNVPEYESIVAQYWELRELQPFMIYWNRKVYLVR
jgi:hypothetical protein